MSFTTVGALLEREHELDALREGLGRASAGDGTLLLVEGPAGVGKTELSREARAAAGRARMVVLEARGSEFERPFAFGVVGQLLEPVVRDPPAHTDLFAGAAGPAKRLFEPEEQQSPGADGDFVALHSLYWLMVNLADHGPVLVSVDDCQWVDRESLRFLTHLAQRIEGLRVAMLLSSRAPDSALADVRSFWAQVAARPEAVALYPRPLTEAAAAILVRERLGTEADDGFCGACHAATGGNPLFLRELLGALESAAVIPSTEAASAVQAVGPAAVARFVLHRLAMLGPSASELARAVAVLGDDSELQLAGRVSGLSENAARDAADDLVRADIFVRSERLGFVHPIVRAALYEDLAPGERQARHGAAAEALAHEGASPERITAHLLLAAATGDPRRIDILRSAATTAAHRGAPRAAAARLRRALAESPSEQQRAEILAELGRWEVAAMQFEAAEEHLRDCLSSDATLSTRADAANWLGRCAIVSSGRSAETAVSAIASLAEEARPRDEQLSLQLGSDLLLVRTCLTRARSGLAAHLEQFREQARGHPSFEAVARIHSAHEHLRQGGSAAAAGAEVQAALAAGLPSGAETTAAFLALVVLQLAEHYDAARWALDVALERGRREGHTTRLGMIHGHRAAVALARGALHDAQVEAETGLLLIEEPHFEFLQLLAVAIVVHVERGALDEAAALAERGEALVAEDRLYVDEFLIARGRLRIAQARVREGVADLLWCRQRLEAVGVSWPSEWRVRAAPALASLGDGQMAEELAQEQLAIARRVGARGALGMSLRAAALALDPTDRLPLLEEAVSVLEQSEARLELAHALASLGAELSRAGRRRDGRAAQRRAIALADECGAISLADTARAELQAGPGRPARTELTGPGALTAAERRVCRQAVEGRSNREVAQALYVTEKTIERHLSSAYQKLGIRSRFQLAAAIGD